MVAMKVTNQVVTERILAGRAIMDPLAEETHSSRSLPVSRVSRPRLLSRRRDGTVVDYFRLPLSLGGSTSALLQRAHAVAWKFEGERCCWGANVVRGGSLLVVFVNGRRYWRGLGVRVRRLLLLRRCRGGTVFDYFRLPLGFGGSTSALLQKAHAVAWRFEGERCCWCVNVFRGGSLLVVVVHGRLYWCGLGV